ncbi:MAG: hypothetical protein CVV12_02760 [Gammaproteobacteria bacterium HGW-Gammaproteobacteria-2]|nr:MAG: hypothetical protein CVV12_02760 [Gammaproteobacteria bacterium HGW-Gammaproteobacteria-2]
MNRRFAKRLFAITGRVLLSVALLFSTGPWAAVLASAQVADCPRMMSDMQYAAGSASHDCCPDAHGDHSVPDCAKQASACSGICNAVSGLAWSCSMPSAAAFTGLPMTTAAPLLRSGVYAPSQFTAPALRPPISI